VLKLGDMSEDAEKPVAPAAGGSKKLLMMVLGFNVLIAGGLGYLVLSGQRGHAAEGKEKHAGGDGAHEGGAEAEGDAKGDKKAGPKFGPLLEVGSFVANLANAGPGPGRYAKVSLFIEATDEEAKVRLELALVPIRSEALMFLSNAKAEDVIGQDKIRVLSEELLKRVNALVGKNSVKRVYFSELVVQ
jgi:flagellar basal body-associated protein FliL